MPQRGGGFINSYDDVKSNPQIAPGLGGGGGEVGISIDKCINNLIN